MCARVSFTIKLQNTSDSCFWTFWSSLRFFIMNYYLGFENVWKCCKDKAACVVVILLFKHFLLTRILKASCEFYSRNMRCTSILLILSSHSLFRNCLVLSLKNFEKQCWKVEGHSVTIAGILMVTESTEPIIVSSSLGFFIGVSYGRIWDKNYITIHIFIISKLWYWILN